MVSTIERCPSSSLSDSGMRRLFMFLLMMLDEFTRECLMTFVARSLPLGRVLDVLQSLFATRDVPDRQRSDNGSEFIAHQVKA